MESNFWKIPHGHFLRVEEVKVCAETGDVDGFGAAEMHV